jgi:hypothetical protein
VHPPRKGKTIKNSRLTPVVLDLIPATDITDRANSKKLRELKKDAAARLCRQAFDQDGCMTLAELSILLKMAPTTASKYLRETKLSNNWSFPVVAPFMIWGLL